MKKKSDLTGSVWQLLAGIDQIERQYIREAREEGRRKKQERRGDVKRSV